VSVPIALKCQGPEEVERDYQTAIKGNMIPNVPLGRVMWVDSREWILKDHHTSQKHSGPFDHQLNIEAVEGVMPDRPPELRKKSPEWQRPEAGESKEGDPQPFEEGPPCSLHHSHQMRNSFKANSSHKERLRRQKVNPH